MTNYEMHALFQFKMMNKYLSDISRTMSTLFKGIQRGILDMAGAMKVYIRQGSRFVRLKVGDDAAQEQENGPQEESIELEEPAPISEAFSFVDNIKDTFKSILDVVHGVGPALKTAFQPLTGKGFWDKAKEFKGNVGEGFKQAFKPLGNSNFVKGMKGFHESVKGTMKMNAKMWLMSQALSLLEPFMELLQPFEVIIELLANQIRVFLLPVMEVLYDVVGFIAPYIAQLGDAMAPLGDLFAGLLSKLFEFIAPLGNVLDMLIGGVAGIAESVSGWWNDLNSDMSDWWSDTFGKEEPAATGSQGYVVPSGDVVHHPGGGGGGFVKGYASGGMFRARPGGYLINVAEGGKDEHVVRGDSMDLLVGEFRALKEALIEKRYII